MKSRLTRGGASVAIALLAGCYDDNPNQTIDIVNEDLRLYVVGDNDGTRNHLAISLGGPGGDLRFSEGDRFYLRVDDVEVPVPDEGTNGFRNVDIPPESARVVAVLDRETDDSAEVEIPVLLTSQITAATAQSRAAGITFTWAASNVPDARLDLTFGGPCLGGVVARALTGDPGRYTLQPADFVAFDGPCTITASLRRQVQRFAEGPTLASVQFDLVRADELASVETVP